MLSPWQTSYHRRLRGKRLPLHRLNENYDIQDFQVAITDFRALKKDSAENVIRDIKRFLVVFCVP